jgi:hypothetical protein
MILKKLNYLKSIIKGLNLIQKCILFLLLINLLIIPFWLMINLNGPLEYGGCRGIKYLLEAEYEGYFADGYCRGITLPELLIWLLSNLVLIFSIYLFSSERK